MPAANNWRPRIESPESIRQLLAFAALFCVAALIYASLIPFKYGDLSWAQACDRWRSIPWLNLDVYYRSDWVANALVVLPAGYLAAAAVDWGRTSRWQLLVATPAITFGLALLVFGIELGQVWFPNRTVSLNDILAESIGGFLGVVVWLAAGQRHLAYLNRCLDAVHLRHMGIHQHDVIRPV
jgi:VanZ family protein